MSSSDAAYLLAKQKNKNRLSSQQAVSATSVNRLEQITEEMDHWKKQLVTVPNTASEKIINRLIQLRAEQTTLLIEKEYTNSPALAKQSASRIMAAYYADCAKLLAVTKQYPNG